MDSKWIYVIISLITTINSDVYDYYDDTYWPSLEVSDEIIDDGKSTSGNFTCRLRPAMTISYNYHIEIIDALECRNVSSANIEQSMSIKDASNIRRKFITYTHSYIDKLKQGVFAKGEIVEKMYFQNTTIDEIETSAFLGLKNLVVLSLAGTKLKNIRNGTFDGLSNLEELLLSNNQIGDTLYEENFTNLPSLTKIDLANNLICYIEPLTFQHQKNLTLINLSKNFIRNINSDVFKFSNNLKYIYLFNNNIIEIEDGAIPRDTKILDLSFNNLTLIRTEIFGNAFDHFALGKFTNMSTLILHHNAIEQFPWTYVPTDIDISYNNIKTLSNVTFGSGSDKFDISHNALVDFNHLQGKYLTNINFSNNKFTGKLGAGKFSEFGKLEVLRMDFNEIQDLELGSFTGLDSLKVLNISFNSLEDISPDAFTPLKTLRVLLISGNKLKNLDMSSLLIHLSALHSVSISHNPWDCGSLSDMLTYLTSKRIQIIHHSLTKNLNAHAIICQNHETSVTSTTVDKLKQVHRTTEVETTTEQNVQPFAISSSEVPNVEPEMQTNVIKNTTDKFTIEDKYPHENESAVDIQNIIKDNESHSYEISALKVCVIILFALACVGMLIQSYRLYKKHIQHRYINMNPYISTPLMEVDAL